MAERAAISIYYLASGALGVPVLDALLAADAVDVMGVGTQPDRPAGRRRVLTPTAVGRHADELGIGAERIPSVNAEPFLERMRGLSPELIVVVAFGQILKPALLELPPFGCLNVHASLLPRHRGAAPVNAAILAGDRQTGVSFMKMDSGLDTGPVYETVTSEIGARETAGELETRLARLAALHISDVIRDIVNGAKRPEPQSNQAVSYAPKLKKADGRIDWTQSAERIERQVRGLHPWPKAFTTIPSNKGGRRLQITAAAVEDGSQHTSAAAAGEVLRADPANLVVACGKGMLRLLEVVPEGRSEMSADAFLRGASVEPGVRLGDQDGRE